MSIFQNKMTTVDPHFFLRQEWEGQSLEAGHCIVPGCQSTGMVEIIKLDPDGIHLPLLSFKIVLIRKKSSMLPYKVELEPPDITDEPQDIWHLYYNI